MILVVLSLLETKKFLSAKNRQGKLKIIFLSENSDRTKATGK